MKKYRNKFYTYYIDEKFEKRGYFMEDIILYGAGKAGKANAYLLYKYGIEIAGFCDSFKSGEVEFECDGKIKKKKIFKLEELSKEQYVMSVTIMDYMEREDIIKKIKEYGFKVLTVEQIFSQIGDIVAGNRKYIAEFHRNGMDNYYSKAEEKENIDIFWGKNSSFYKMFQKMNIERIIELACGQGRHVPWYIKDAKKIVLVDILDKNIELCKERFQGEEKIEYCINSGYDFRNLPSGFFTALFSYDAMVHFEMLDIFQYLKETERVLCRGGRALFHHSNNISNYKVTFATGKHGRNYMSRDLFAYLANRAGLIILEQKEIDWGGEKKLDCITLVEKP